MSEHIVSVKVYLVIFFSLMVFTVLTVITAKYDLGRLNAIVALTIAVIKATLVVLYFMHARYSSRLTQVIIVSGMIWLFIMIAFTLTDYLTRHGWPPAGV
jgi:cytochrome c oxidase subunit 4